MDTMPLRAELDTLDHRRSRLQEILDLGLVSQELAGHLRQTLAEIDQRIATLNPDTDRDYAWATVKVYRSGKVKVTAYGFDEHYGPTHVIQKVIIP